MFHAMFNWLRDTDYPPQEKRLQQEKNTLFEIWAVFFISENYTNRLFLTEKEARKFQQDQGYLQLADPGKLMCFRKFGTDFYEVKVKNDPKNS